MEHDPLARLGIELAADQVANSLDVPDTSRAVESALAAYRAAEATGDVAAMDDSVYTLLRAFATLFDSKVAANQLDRELRTMLS